jgi:hypothetical protein
MSFPGKLRGIGEKFLRRHIWGGYGVIQVQVLGRQHCDKLS